MRLVSGRGEGQARSPCEFALFLTSQLQQDLKKQEIKKGRKEKRQKAKRKHWSQPLAPNAHPPPLLARAGWKLEGPTNPGVFKLRLMGRLGGAEKC